MLDLEAKVSSLEGVVKQCKDAEAGTQRQIEQLHQEVCHLIMR